MPQPPRTAKPARLPASAKPPTPPRGPVRAPRSSATVSTVNMASDAAGQMGEAVAAALFGAPPKPRRRRSAPQKEDQGGQSMEPTLGSVLSFSPAAPGWTALVTDGEKSWQEAVVGWAVVVIWTAYQADQEGNDEVERTQGTKQFQTEVQPVMVAEAGGLEVPMFREGIQLVSLSMPGQVLINAE